MVRFEEKKMIIEIESMWPTDEWRNIVHDLVFAIGALDKDRIDNDNDCTYGMCHLLLEMMPHEFDLQKMLNQEGTIESICNNRK